MGKQARLKQQRRVGVKLNELEARQILAAQANELRATLAARETIERCNAAMRAAVDVKNAAFAALTKKYHLDPKQPYSLDENTLMLVPEKAGPIVL